MENPFTWIIDLVESEEKKNSFTAKSVKIKNQKLFVSQLVHVA